jgi:zinc transporter ZupT
VKELNRFSIAAPVAATFIAIAFGMASIALAAGRRMRYIVPVSGMLLAAVALLGLVPELAQVIGWARTLSLAAAGYGLLAVLDHHGYAVCPSCSHGEKFAGSLVAATAFHAFVDGWGVSAARDQGAISGAITFAILLHKAPEGLALGAMLRAATPGPLLAVMLCIAAEFPTLLGGAVSLWGTPPAWVQYILALVSGTFLFLGLHAVMTTWAARARPAPTESGG